MRTGFRRLWAVLLLGWCVLAPAMRGRAQLPGTTTLGQLMTPRHGKLLHFASTDPNGRNADFRSVAPGETLTLLDYHGGAGIVRRFWVTIAPRNSVVIQRQAIVRCYWDGETQPSVEVPISDFFGVGFGEWKQFQSLPLNMTSGGYNCYWPMPFHHSARITIENRSKARIDALYYNVDVETHRTLPADTLYFHAQFRRQRPTVRGRPYVVLETTGSGQYVGTLLSMQRMRGRGFAFLEGNEQVTVDGEKTPSIQGTGTEDYFCSGWYFDTGVYSAPYHGVTILDPDKSRVSAYRWHIEDAIPFTRSLRFAIQHGPVNDVDADYASVAFYYQTHPHPAFPPLPADLLPADPLPPFHVVGIVEAESLASSAQATSGSVSVQDMTPWNGDWSGDAQLFWQPDAPGAKLRLTLTAPRAGEYGLSGYFTLAPDYGDLQVRVNDGPPLPRIVRGYAPDVRPSGEARLGRVNLREGANTIELEVAGKASQSRGYFAGIDGFTFTPETAATP